jgi:two-component system sensor histidine kinase/response regulator
MLEYFKARLLHYHRSLTIANEQLKESNRVKERMLSILSHDFNAPIGNLITSLDLLDEQFLTPEEFNTTSGKLKVQLQVLTSSMKDVLQWSKMQIRGDVGERTSINICRLLEEIFVLFETAINEKKLIISNNLTSDMVIYANLDHVKLIFRNLISNAIKFSHNGGTIYINSEKRPGRLNITIKDEGTGMPTNILNALQNEQLTFTSTTGTAKERGTGLGLMFVREFVQKNNGELTITSEPGKGSAFCISLPHLSE